MAQCEDFPCCGHTDGLPCDWNTEVTADDGDEGTTTVKVRHALIMRTARYVIANRGRQVTGASFPAWSRELEVQSRHLVFNADEADFDAVTADELLQLAVLGEVIFG